MGVWYGLSGEAVSEELLPFPEKSSDHEGWGNGTTYTINEGSAMLRKEKEGLGGGENPKEKVKVKKGVGGANSYVC